jgi:hypothetical protein
MAVVSDVAANHVETLYGNGSRTLAALLDLIEICQAAVLYDRLTLSPTARKRCSFLRQFDFAWTPAISVSEAAAEPAHPEPAGDDDRVPITIDADQEGPFSTSAEGALMLAMLLLETFHGDPVFGLLVDVGRMPAGADPGRYLFARLPALMLALQHHRRLVTFADETARTSLDEIIKPLLDRYTQYSRHVLRLQQRWRVGLVSSVLEQPIVASVLVDRVLADPDRDARGEHDDDIARFNAALLREPAGEECFEQCRFPPVGLMVLAQARSLDDVPAAIREMRGRFEGVRQQIASIEAELGELSRGAARFWANAGRAAQERDDLHRRLRETYAGFDEAINADGQWGRRTEIWFNALDFALSVAAPLGLGTVEKLLELLGVKRMLMMHRVPGLLGLASVVRDADSALVTDIAARLLGHSDTLQAEANLLQAAYDHGESYVRHHGEAPPVMFGMKLTAENEPPLELTDRQMWMELVRNDDLRELLMPAGVSPV